MSFHEEIPIKDIAGFDRFAANGTLQPSRSSVNAALIGHPRGTYGADCQSPDNPDFKALVDTANVGPFEVTGLRAALIVLRAIMDDVRVELPDLYPRLGHMGMLCCRRVRGSQTAISSHSWGLAIDLTINGRLDTWNDNRVQRGLLKLWPIFNRHGFYWGIAFPREDAMHFEASEQLVRSWARDGAFGPTPARMPPTALTSGDRGPRVLALQKALNVRLAPSTIDEDGIFGPQTQLALMVWQRRAGLTPDGRGTAPTLASLGL